MYYVIKRNDHEYFTGDGFSFRQRDAKRFDATAKAMLPGAWLVTVFGAGVRFVKITQRSDRAVQGSDTSSQS